MSFLSICSNCHKKRLFVRYRSYVCIPIGNKTITTTNKLCGKCAKKLNTIIKQTNENSQGDGE